MPYPTPYERDFGFQSYADIHPGIPAPGHTVDSEYDAVSQAVIDIVNFLKLSIRSDGKLLNGSVGVDALAADLKLGFKVPTTWAVSTSYVVADTVWYGSAFYTCITAHTSGGSFNPGYFSLIADFGAAAIAYTNAAAVSAAAAGASATTASTAASTVTASANQRVAFADTLTNAKALFGSLVTVAAGFTLIVAGYAALNDGYGGTFHYKSGDTTTSFGQDGLGFADNQGRRWFRQYSGAVNLFWFARGNGTDESTGIQAFFTAIPADGEGYVPRPPVSFSHASTITKDGRLNIRGVGGLGSWLKYTGAANAFTWTNGRFSSLRGIYWTWGDTAVGGGIDILGARESVLLEDVFAENQAADPTVNAYALRISSSWDIQIVRGRYRASKGIWGTATNTFDGQPAVVNSLHLSKVKAQLCDYGVYVQSADVVVIDGVSDIEGCDVGIAIACDIAGTFAVNVLTIWGNYLEGNNTDILIGNNNSSASTPSVGNIGFNRLAAATQIIDLVKCNSVTVWENQFGTGAKNIRAGASNINWNSRAAVTDAGPSTTYMRNGDITIQGVGLKGYISNIVLNPPQITSNQDNYNPTSAATSSYWHLTSDASRNITGIVPPANNAALTLVNTGAQPIVLKNNDVNSAAANRFVFSGAADITIAASTRRTIVYDATLQRWLD